MFRRRKPFHLPFGDHRADDDRDIHIFTPDEAAHSHLWSEARLLVRDVLFAVLFAVLLMVFVVQPVKVEGSSMLPRLHDGERIFVNKLIYYGYPKLRRGDIVVFWYPDDPADSYIKRVIGLPGETIEVRDGRVTIDGAPLDEPYLDPQRNRREIYLPPVLVKQHYYFVMGDNRDRSSDSRAWGLVPEKYIYGKAIFRFLPLSEAGALTQQADAEPRLLKPESDAPIETDDAGLEVR